MKFLNFSNKKEEEFVSLSAIVEGAVSSVLRRCYSGGEEKIRQEKRHDKNLKDTRQELERLLKNNVYIKYAFKSIQTYCAPRKYRASTGCAGLNDKINYLVEDWMSECHADGRWHFRTLAQLMVARPLIDGAHSWLIINDKEQGTLIQPISEYRIGGGEQDGCPLFFNQDESKKEKEKKELEKKGRYFAGREFNEDGILTHYWIYREKRDNEILSDGSNSWVFDKKVEAKNMLVMEDPLNIEDIRQTPELSQSINNIKDHDETMDGLKSKVKALSRKLGTIKSDESDAGDFSTSFFEENKKDESGEKEEIKVSKVDVNGLAIDVMKTDEEFKIIDSDLPAASLQQFLECITAAPALALHLPPSFLAVKGKLHGTDVRADLEKAVSEIKRKRQLFKDLVLNKLIRKQLVFWYEKGEFKSFKKSLEEILKGDWLFAKDPDVDQGRNLNSTLSLMKIGVLSDEHVAQRLGIDGDIAAEREAQVDKLLESAKRVSEDKGVPLEVVLRLFKEQNLGTVPEIEEENQNNTE